MRTLGVKFVYVIVAVVALLALSPLSGCTVLTGSEGILYVRDYPVWRPDRADYYQQTVIHRDILDVNLTGAGRFGSPYWDGWSHGNYGHGRWSGHGWPGYNPRGGRFNGDCR